MVFGKNSDRPEGEVQDVVEVRAKTLSVFFRNVSEIPPKYFCQSFSEMLLKFPQNISVSIFPKYFCDFFKVFLSLFSQNISVTVQFQVKALDHPPGTRLKVFQFLMLEIFNPTTDQSYPQCTYIEVDQVGYF